MCEEKHSKRGKNLWEYVDTYCKEDINTYKIKVFEKHNSEDFKIINKNYKKELCSKMRKSMIKDILEYIEVCEEEFN